jgi:hypothetical protein
MAHFQELPVVYRWAYDYSVPGAEQDSAPSVCSERQRCLTFAARPIASSQKETWKVSGRFRFLLACSSILDLL